MCLTDWMAAKNPRWSMRKVILGEEGSTGVFVKCEIYILCIATSICVYSCIQCMLHFFELVLSDSS